MRFNFLRFWAVKKLFSTDSRGGKKHIVQYGNNIALKLVLVNVQNK